MDMRCGPHDLCHCAVSEASCDAWRRCPRGAGKIASPSLKCRRNDALVDPHNAA
jgi:hypothetical protein